MNHLEKLSVQGNMGFGDFLVYMEIYRCHTMMADDPFIHEVRHSSWGVPGSFCCCHETV